MTPPGTGPAPPEPVTHARAPAAAAPPAAVLDALGQAVVATDLDGCVISWNPAAARLYGWSAAEMIGRPLLDVTVAPARRAEARRAQDLVAQGITWEGDVEPRRRDGSTFTAHVVLAPLRDGERVIGGVGVFHDITARRAAEQDLARSEQLLRTLFDALGQGYGLCELVLDAAGSPVDYRFLEVNALFEELTGLPDPVGRTAFELVDGLEPEWLQTYAEVGLGRRTLHFERGSAALGRHYDVLAVPIEPAPRFAVLFQDRTARRRAEEALRDAAASAAFRARLIETLRTVGDPVQVQAEAVRLLGDHLGAARVQIGDVDETGRYGIVQNDYHPGLPSAAGIYRFDDYGPAAMDVFRAGRTLVIDDVATDPRLTDDERAATASLRIGSYVMEPLVREGRVVNVLVVHHELPHRWTPAELGVIRDTAEHTWSAVTQARVESARHRKHARAELVARILAELEEQPTPALRYQRLTELLVPAFADYATVELPDRDDPLLAAAHRDPDLLEVLRVLRRRHRVGADDPRSSSRAVAGEPQLISVITPALAAEYSTDPIAGSLLDRLAPRSHMVAPLDLGGGSRGILMVGISDPDRPVFCRDDVSFLSDAAQRVGVLLSAARVRQEEHDIAVRLQQALLPDTLVWHPAVPIEARYHAADALLEVGGDWYDTFRWPSGHIGIMVGDVVGHTLDSAAAMGRLRAATAALAAYTPPDPAALLAALERFARGPDGIDFVTAVCVVVDPASGELAYSSAGHPPALVVPPGGGAPIRLEEAQSTPLCTLAVRPRPVARHLLEPGSLVVLYTDGLVERRRQSLESGLVRLEEAAAAVSSLPLAQVADRLVADLAVDSPPQDDVVVACLRYTPEQSRFERCIPARGEELSRLRADLRGWMNTIDLTALHRDHVLLGVGEACANAIEHAYAGRPAGRLEIELVHHGHHVTARIRDDGAWRPAGPRTEDRGRGTPIMRALTSRFTRRTGPGGTTVTLTLPVPPPEDQP